MITLCMMIYDMWHTLITGTHFLHYTKEFGFGEVFVIGICFLIVEIWVICMLGLAYQNRKNKTMD